MHFVRFSQRCRGKLRNPSVYFRLMQSPGKSCLAPIFDQQCDEQSIQVVTPSQSQSKPQNMSKPLKRIENSRIRVKTNRDWFIYTATPHTRNQALSLAGWSMACSHISAKCNHHTWFKLIDQHSMHTSTLNILRLLLSCLDPKFHLTPHSNVRLEGFTSMVCRATNCCGVSWAALSRTKLKPAER